MIFVVAFSTKVKMLVRDSKQGEKQAQSAASELLSTRCVGFIAAESSGPTMQVSSFLSQPTIDRSMISCSATSPKLSESKFSNFVRTPPSDAVPAQLVATLMKGVLSWSF